MVEFWQADNCSRAVCNWNELTGEEHRAFIENLNSRFPVAVYHEQVAKRRSALLHMKDIRDQTARLPVSFPESIQGKEITGSFLDMAGCAVVLTAGGEGERLRSSLLEQGADPALLSSFTKATWPLGLYEDFGALQTNCAILSHIEQQAHITIPVIVTTGPSGSITARVVEQILVENKNFGLKQVRILEQDERLHLTNEEKIAWKHTDGIPVPVTNPDETGGPLMKLKAPDATGLSALDWCFAFGVTRLLILQATAIYDPALVCALAKVAQTADGVGVGIKRTSFPPGDPYGSYVVLGEHSEKQLRIVEAAECSVNMRELRTVQGDYLPYNTGFYALSPELLKVNDLPDYATSPKEVLPHLPKSPKIGYAATDILPMAENPVVLVVDEAQFHVIKGANDLALCAALGKRLGLDTLCKDVRNRIEKL